MKSKKSSVKQLQASIKELELTIKSLEEESKLYPFKEEEVKSFISITFDSFPVLSLRDSLEIEHGLPRNKLTLKTYKRKFQIRKLYNKAVKELNLKKDELKIAQIDLLLKDIKLLSIHRNSLAYKNKIQMLTSDKFKKSNECSLVSIPKVSDDKQMSLSMN
jgi:hypothetical protein